MLGEWRLVGPSLAQGSGLALTGVLVAGGRGSCCRPGAPYSTCI